MKKKEKVYDIADIAELEVIDSKYYTLNQFSVKGKQEKTFNFVYAPRAQALGISGFEVFDFFSVKENDGKWIVSEATTGKMVYRSEKPEAKILAIANTVSFLKKKVKNAEGLWKVVNEKLNIYGLSPRYRGI